MPTLAAPKPPKIDAADGLGSVLAFVCLTVLLTAPIWVLSAVTGVQILPGLPIAAVAVICPVAAALVLTIRSDGPRAGFALLARALDGGRIRPAVWWLAILFILPAVSIAAFWILRFGGSPIPNPQINITNALTLSAFFLLGALGEELGWSGFALDRLQVHFGPLTASLVLGAIWAAWHYPALLQAHRPLAWIAWWSLGTFSLRLIMVWLFNSTNGSVFAVAVCHAVSNLCWQLFPRQGSWFDPRLHGLLVGAVALVVALVMLAQRRDDPAHAQTRLAIN